MMRVITAFLSVMFVFSQVCKADMNQLGHCELKEVDAVEGWGWIKNGSRFEFAEICEYPDVESASSIILYGNEKGRSDVVYREYFVASDIREEDVFRAGVAFPSLTHSAQSWDFGSDGYFTLTSRGDIPVLIDVYKNGILAFLDCMGNDLCVNSFLNDYEYSENCVNGEYAEFREQFSGIEDRQSLIADVSSFRYDENMNRMTFHLVMPNEERWSLRVRLRPTGEVDELISVSRVTR